MSVEKTFQNLLLVLFCSVSMHMGEGQSTEAGLWQCAAEKGLQSSEGTDVSLAAAGVASNQAQPLLIWWRRDLDPVVTISTRVGPGSRLLQVVTGQVATSLSKFAMHGHIADSASAKAAVTVFEFGFSGMSCSTGGANGRGRPSGCRRLCQQEEQMGMLLQSQPWLASLRLGLHQTCREEGPSRCSGENRSFKWPRSFSSLLISSDFLLLHLLFRSLRCVFVVFELNDLSKINRVADSIHRVSDSSLTDADCGTGSGALAAESSDDEGDCEEQLLETRRKPPPRLA